MVPRPAAPLLGLLQRLTGRTATGTTKAYLDARVRSPALRAVLASQWGDYGLPPSRSAFAAHAMIVSHYLGGGWFPEGGSARIARTFEKGIEQAGGAVRVAQEVTQILIEDGAAAGVRVLDRRGPDARERTYRAPVVVSAAGAAATLSRLLPVDGAIGRATAPARRAIARLGTGMSAVTVFLRLREDPRSIGVDGGNVWVSRDLDHEAGGDGQPDPDARAAALLAGRPDSVFVSFPSIKSGRGPHTAEIIAFSGAGAFRPWADRPQGGRGAEYSALKERIASGMLALAETAVPGLSELVEYTEVSTPLTFEHYTAHPAGAFYGMPATPQRYKSRPLGPRTAVPGLLLSGQDAGSLGIAGAMMGGVAAACQALGPRGLPMIASAVRTGPSARPAARPRVLPEGKHRAAVVSKRRLTPSVWEVTLELEGPVGTWAPGQFARLHVGDDAWRDYSIAGLENGALRLLVSTRTGGAGSRFIERAETGARTVVELPLGRYRLKETGRRHVFVATGTGLAPLPGHVPPRRGAGGRHAPVRLPQPRGGPHLPGRGGPARSRGALREPRDGARPLPREGDGRAEGSRRRAVGRGRLPVRLGRHGGGLPGGPRPRGRRGGAHRALLSGAGGAPEQYAQPVWRTSATLHGSGTSTSTTSRLAWAGTSLLVPSAPMRTEGSCDCDTRTAVAPVQLSAVSWLTGTPVAECTVVLSPSICSPESMIAAISASSARAAGEPGTVVDARAAASPSLRAVSRASESSTTTGSMPLVASASALPGVCGPLVAGPPVSPESSAAPVRPGACEGGRASAAGAASAPRIQPGSSGSLTRASAPAPTTRTNTSSARPRRLPRRRRPTG